MRTLQDYIKVQLESKMSSLYMIHSGHEVSLYLPVIIQLSLSFFVKRVVTVSTGHQRKEEKQETRNGCLCGKHEQSSREKSRNKLVSGTVRWSLEDIS